jgi:hypothetical protein
MGSVFYFCAFVFQCSAGTGTWVRSIAKHFTCAHRHTAALLYTRSTYINTKQLVLLTAGGGGAAAGVMLHISGLGLDQRSVPLLYPLNLTTLAVEEIS